MTSTPELSKQVLHATEILKQVEEVRKRNNTNWMDLARLAFEVAPDRAKEIMKKITAADAEINTLTKELAK